jgi:type IV secretory pathway VirJ component
MVRDTAEQALRQTGAARLVLIGHSFGANVLLAGVEQLPPALRARVATVVLLVPGDTMLFRATPGGALDFGADDGPAIGFARRLDWVPVLCVHGEVEEHSLCPLWHAPNLLVRTLPGGHYLGHDDAAVARAVLTQVARTA